MSYANNLVLSNGYVSVENVMRAAHTKARAVASDRAELQRRFGVKRTYAQDFQEALASMWARAYQMQGMAAA